MRALDLALVPWFAVALAAPLASQSTKLNRPLSGSQDVYHYEMSRDGRRVVYLADQDVVGVLNLYSVGLGGEGSKRLESGYCNRVVISPDSQRVVFTRFPSGLCSVPI